MVFAQTIYDPREQDEEAAEAYRQLSLKFGRDREFVAGKLHEELFNILKGEYSIQKSEPISKKYVDKI